MDIIDLNEDDLMNEVRTYLLLVKTYFPESWGEVKRLVSTISVDADVLH